MGDERIPPVDEVQLLRAAACDWRLSRGDVGSFAVILKHCDDDWTAFPGPARIAKEARLSVTSVKKSIRTLEQFRYLEVIRPGLRKKNRFRVLQSPGVPHREMVAAAREFGLPSANKAKRSNWARTIPQSGTTPKRATGEVQRPPTGEPRLQQLGKRRRHEVAFKALEKSQELLSSTEEEQERSAEELAEDEAREWRIGLKARSLYLEAKSAGNDAVMAMLERDHAEAIAEVRGPSQAEKYFVAHVLTTGKAA